MSTAEIILAVLGLLLAGGGIAGVINALVSKIKAKGEIKNMAADTEKKEAETAEIITRAAGAAAQLLEKQLVKLQDENQVLSCKLTALENENTELRNVQARHEKEITVLQSIAEKFDEVLGGAHTLYDQVVELHGEPKYKPPERRKRS